MFKGRGRHGPKGRKPKPIWLGVPPIISAFISFPQVNLTSIYLKPAELEALRSWNPNGSIALTIKKVISS